MWNPAVATDRQKSPTMRDVADMVGVSLQTVSAVINGKPGITDETRARVLQAVKELGYRPYSVARSLRTRQTRTVALVVPDIANPFCATLASVSEDYAHLFGYNLILHNTHDDVQRETAYIDSLAQRWTDGVLFVSAEDRIASLDILSRAGIPAVAVDHIPEDYEGPAVTLDNVKAGRIAAEHLLAMGHTRVAHIAGPLRLSLARERSAGFRATIENRGLEAYEVCCTEENWRCVSGYQAMQQLLARDLRPTAVFAANDRMAIGAMGAIREAGLRVPDDISVVGLDDIEVAAFQIPPLTTVSQAFAEIATSALKILLEMIEKGEAVQPRVVIDPVLIIRQSTAPPPTVLPGGRP